jgi:hypothetical protein
VPGRAVRACGAWRPYRIGLTQALDREHPLALALDLDEDLTPARALGPNVGLTLDRDLAVARLLQSDRMRLEVTWAGLGLLEAWAARRARSGKMALGLHAFVAEALADCAQAQPQDDPPAALGRVIATMSTERANSWVRRALSRAQELLAPPRGGDGSAARDNLVLAAFLAITASAPQGEDNHPNVFALQGVLATLIALTIPEHENQAVLLVRV